MGIDGVGSFPTAGGCDDSEESDWPAATTRSKQFRKLNEQAWEWREASHMVRTRFGTRLSAIDYAAVRTAQQFRKLCCW